VTLKLVIKPAAESDLLEIFTWYEDRQSGLGAVFIEEIQSCFDLILQHPEIFQEIDKDIHRAVTRVFPYCVFYTNDEENVFILAVLHAAQRPDYIRSRWDA